MAEAASCFRRFRIADKDAVLKTIAKNERALRQAMSSGDERGQLMPRLQLCFCLTPLDRESEAIAHLEAALALSRKFGEKAREIEALLHLGTAVQYAGDRNRALTLFAEGLAKAEAYDIQEQVHFLLYHRGRCEVELGQSAVARESFAAALAIRERMGVPRLIETARAALKDIEAL
jgi:tetratricopeptide (TPR) repeat protein